MDMREGTGEELGTGRRRRTSGNNNTIKEEEAKNIRVSIVCIQNG